MAHRVVAVTLPEVVAFDLATPTQVFGHRTERRLYDFVVCAERPGAVASSTSFAIGAQAGLAALETADTVIVPGYLPLDDPQDQKEMCPERRRRICGTVSVLVNLRGCRVQYGRNEPGLDVVHVA